MELEIVRLVLLACMFGITGISDLKTRYFEDKILIPFVVLGLLTYLVDYPSMEEIVLMALGIIVSFVTWYLRMVPTGDLFGMVIFSILMPEFFFYFLGASFGAALVYAVTKNYLKNKSVGSAEQVFSEYDEPLYKKKFGYFLFHKNYDDEKFTFSAETTENGNKKFSFLINAESEFSTKKGLVAYTLPMMFFFFCGTVLLLISSLL